jgi:hypothetical protein
MTYLLGITRRASRISLTLFRLMVPIILLMKLAEELGLVGMLSAALQPVMQAVGLPGAMGLVWATALVTNLYGGIVVFAGVAASTPLTVAQVTVISSMLLIAHALPVEARIAQKAGVSMPLTITFRVLLAVVYGFLLNQFYQATAWLQQPLELSWTPALTDVSLLRWALDQLLGLLMIFAIVWTLVLVLDVLTRVRLIDWINASMRPVMSFLGINRQAETITLVGLSLGISYGGVLLIEQAREGHIAPHDVLYSMCLLGLSHSLIEDTLLMMVIGADISGILIGRVLFSLAVIFVLIRLVRRLKPDTVQRWMVKSVAPRTIDSVQS